MTVYLGDAGGIELERTAGQAVHITMRSGDVSEPKRRWSPEDDLSGVFLTGDQVDISTEDGSDLYLVANHPFNDWRGFIYVNEMGAFRLYDNYEEALAGDKAYAVELVDIPDGPGHLEQKLIMKTRGDTFTPLARITSYELTTERETIDITHLGQKFVQQYEAGLISGQGSIDCYWEHQIRLCDPDICNNNVEFPVYLSKLCLRLTQGADFFGRFFVYQSPDTATNSVWYEGECIVTSASVTVSAIDAIKSRIEFVTTGPFVLRSGRIPSYLLLEDANEYVLKEDGIGKLLVVGDD